MSLDVHPVLRELGRARQEPGAMRAATMTFAVFFDSEQIAGWVRERTRALAGKHPSRVLVLDGTTPAGELRVERSDSRGEWIEIGVRGADAGALDAALAALELPNAPVVLLWVAEAICDDERFLRLSRRARATICSSSVTRTDGGGLRDLTTFVERHPEVVLHDIAYLRLTSWQELIAEFFDEPSCRRELRALRGVEVAAGSDAEMYYVLGWLASRLAWAPLSAGRFKGPVGNVDFTMRREGPPRRLSRIVLTSLDATFVASIHPEDPATICLEARFANTSVTRCAPLHTVDLASLVERAILARARDEIFIESLAMARHILERQAA